MKSTNGQARRRGPERILAAATLAAVAMLGCSDDDGGSLNPTAPSAVNAPATASSASAIATVATPTSTGADAASSGDQITVDGNMTSTRRLNADTTGTLTANLLAPADHDGSPFVVELHFSEPIVTKPRHVRGDDAFSVTGGSITNATRPNRQRRSNGEWMASQWELTVQPSGSGDVVLEAPGGRSCTENGAFCTEASQSLSHALSATIRGTGTSEQQGGSGGNLTATLRFPAFAQSSPFVGLLVFSEPIVDSYHAVRENAFSVTGGSITKAKRLYGHSDQWELTVAPSGSNDVVLTAPGGRSCAETGALCTRARQSLSHALDATIPGDSQDPQAPGPVTDLKATWRLGFDYSVSFSIPEQPPLPMYYEILVGGCVGGARRITVQGHGGSDFYRSIAAGGGVIEEETRPATLKFGAEGFNRAGRGPCTEVTTLIPMADLVVGFPRASPSSPVRDGLFRVFVDVGNDGDTTLSKRPWLRVYLSTDATITTSDTQVGERTLGAVFAGQPRNEQIEVRAPSSPGTYYYGVCVRSYSEESDTTNNCSGGLQVVVR